MNIKYIGMDIHKETISIAVMNGELRAAIEQLTQAIVSESALQQNQKQEVVEAIATLSQEAAKKPEERSKGTGCQIVPARGYRDRRTRDHNPQS
jgi:hypothetical protein